MSVSEGLLVLAAILIIFGGGYGLILKHQIDRDSRELENELTPPPAE